MHTMMLVAQACFSLGSLHGAWQFNQVVKWLSKLRGWDMAGVRWCYLWALPSCHCWLSWGLLLGEIFDDASPVVGMNPRVTPDTFRLLVRVTNPLINPFLGVTIGVVGRIGGPKQCMQTIFRICNELDFQALLVMLKFDSESSISAYLLIHVPVWKHVQENPESLVQKNPSQISKHMVKIQRIRTLSLNIAPVMLVHFFNPSASGRGDEPTASLAPAKVYAGTLNSATKRGTTRWGVGQHGSTLGHEKSKRHKYTLW